jgi:hypothetical protein
MSVNQLLAKAMSTSSEEEALACLRMARKKGKTFEAVGSGDYNGHDAKYWYEKAASFYQKAKEHNELADTVKTYARMYHNETLSVLSQRETIRRLESQIRQLKDKPTGWWHYPVMATQLIALILLVLEMR